MERKQGEPINIIHIEDTYFSDQLICCQRSLQYRSAPFKS